MQNNEFNIDNVIQADSKDVLEKLQKGVKKVLGSDNYKDYLRFMGSFRRYSFNNQLLLYFQALSRGIKPTIFAGFTTWKNLDIRVKKGEKAFAVLAPIIKKVPVVTKKVAVDDELTPTDESTDLTAGNSNELVEKVVGFRVVKRTFDISQTDGKIPEICKDLKGAVENKDEILRSLEEVSGIKFEYADIKGGAKGYFSIADNRIVLQSGMSDLQTIKTAIHETAHSILHCESGIEANAPRNAKEVQAESVAFMVSDRLGLDTSDYSFSYIADWSGKQEDKLLVENFEVIRDTSNKILDGIAKNTNLAQDISTVVSNTTSLNKGMTL